MPSDAAAFHLGLVVVLAVVIVGLARVASRISVPLPILHVAAGLAWGLVASRVPALPTVSLTPDVAFLVLLPPLLVASAYELPLGFFRKNLRAISILSVALVLATDAVVALLVHAVMPEVPLSAAFVLGAIVAPPDPAAATSIVRRMGLPNRVVTILEGEGLLNDATALTALQVALGAVATGVFTWRAAAQVFVAAASGGIAIGFGVAWVFARVLRRIDDAVLEVALTLALPYAAFAVANVVSASGVLAAVAAGFTLRHYVLEIHRASTRLASRAVWSIVVFLVNGFVFVMLGLTLGTVAARGLSARLLGMGALVSGAAIALRLAWMLVAPRLARLVVRGRDERPAPAFRELLVLGWAGPRGVVSLAAALSIPYATAKGPFPARDVIVDVSLIVIFATLVLQGGTLPFVVRALDVGDPGARAREEERARREAREAAHARLEALAGEADADEDALGEIRERYERRFGRRSRDVDGDDRELRRIEREVAHAELDAVLRLRDDGTISDDVAQKLESEIDLRRVTSGEDG